MLQVVCIANVELYKSQQNPLLPRITNGANKRKIHEKNPAKNIAINLILIEIIFKSNFTLISYKWPCILLRCYAMFLVIH